MSYNDYATSVSSVCKTYLISRLKKSNVMQQYADIYLLLNYCRCFGRPSRPSSGVHKTVVAASGTDHTIWGATFLKRGQSLRKLAPQILKRDQIRTGLESYGPKSVVIWSRLRKLAPHIVWSVPEGTVPNQPYLVTFEEVCSPGSMIFTRGCNYSFMYSWWWARWTPETSRVIQQ